MKNSLRPAQIISPGEFLAELIDDRDWTVEGLAEIIDRPKAEVEAIVAGRRPITPEFALRLSEAFDSSPSFFMNLEVNYRIWLAQDECAESLSRIRDRVAKLPHVESA